MKRSKNVIRDRFRKVNTIKYTAIALAIGSTFILSACDSEETVSVYRSVQECKAQGTNPYKCEDDYKTAQKDSSHTAPHYKNDSDCKAEFDNGCQKGTYSSGGFFWYPIMTGFHSSGSGYSSQPLYISKGNFVDAGGYNYGSTNNYSTTRTVSRSGLAAKPATTSTTTRGGFGSTVTSRSFSSSSGGSHSSFGG